MAGVNMTVDWSDRGLQRALTRLANRVDDMRPAFKDVGEYMLRSIERRFNTQKDPRGRPWAPLSARRRKQKKHPKILTERRRMRRSYVYRAEPDRLRVGTNVIYAAIHQFGGQVRLKARTQVLIFNRKGRFMKRSAARRSKAKSVRVGFAAQAARTIRIPARPVLGLSSADAVEIVRIAREHLERASER